MLPRVLEPEVMDTPDEAREYDSMDHAEVNTRFVTDFLAYQGACRGGRILDVGTGTALIPIELCRRDPKARVLAIDLAESMLNLGRRHVEAAGLSERISLQRRDAKAIDLDDADPGGGFEAVISNSLVHHLAEPIAALREMVRLVARGGTVFVRDLARPSSRVEMDNLVERYAGSETELARSLFAASLQAALTVDEVGDLVDQLGLPRAGVSLSSDRHWTWSWIRP